MEALPQLALELICEYLMHGEPHKRSLLAFASTSRTCRTAARRQLFFKVSIDVDDMPQFHQNLVRLERTLDQARSRSCVRLLKLGGSTVFQTEDSDGDCGTSIKSIPKLHPTDGLRKWRSRPNSRPAEWWQPLTRFLSSLHLKHLIWESAEQIPHCVLSVLREQIPSCRLHVHGFDLQSLQQRGTLHDVDDTEYLIAISPSLHHIIAPYSMYDASGCANYNGEAVLRLVAGLAPNLKNVCIWENSLMPSGEVAALQRDARPEWPGFHPQSKRDWFEPPKSRGQLQRLEISALHAVSGSHLATWEAHNNFSGLRSLKLARQIELGVVQRLAGLAERNALGQLRVLDLPAASCEYADREEFEVTMTQLLLLLPPLAELSIVGVAKATFGAAIQQHGSALQSFRVKDFIVSPQQINQLQELCPNITELSIEILRSGGDIVEVEVYRTLGSMRYLESLSLMLRCTDYRPGEGPDDPCLLMGPSHDEEDQEKMALAIRRVFVNAAMDESLARCIFQTILAAHTSVIADLPPRLKNICLTVGGVRALNDQSMDLDFQGVLGWIGRSWACRRDPRDSHQSDVTVEEVDSNTRQHSIDELEDDMDEFPNSEQYAGIWTSLWPKTGAGWREDWRSIPLVDCARTPTISEIVRLE